MTLINEVRSKVKLNTFDESTREMKRLKVHMTRMIVDIDVATAVARQAYVHFRY